MKPYYYTACSARLQGLFAVRGAFFGILGARALHRLVFLTELVVQLERTPRGIVLGDDGLERDDHAAAAKRREQRVELGE